MALSHSPRIVTNGLVIYLDAANPKSYPGTGTTWSDISGNSEVGSLLNGVAYNSDNLGSFIFDGTDDRVSVSSFDITTSEATFLVALKRDGIQPDNEGILFSRGTSVTGLNFRGNSNELAYHWNGGNFSWDSNLLVPDNIWSFCALSVQSSLATMYLYYEGSDILSSVNTATHSTTTLDNLFVGIDTFSSARSFKGNISIAAIYNRALSTAEIEQTFVALRGRYK
jgi:hypothetical protein